MSRRWLAGLILWLAAAGAIARPPNLVFILTDNQPASLLGAYGNPDVRTPNIDRLAEEGMLFTHAMAANGMCSPTRATLMTGLMPSQHGVHNWLDDARLEEWPRNWSAIAEFRTLPLTLANRGFQTAMIGKWHLGQPWEAQLGFQHWVTFTYGHTIDFWDNTVIENGRTYLVTDQHTVDFFADKAVEYLQRVDTDRPFYLQLNLNGPYLNPPSNAGAARNRHYRSYLHSDFASFPRVAFNANVARQLTDPATPPFLIDKHLEAIAMHNDRETMANVASQNTVVDDAVGRVMAVLESRDLAASTLVVFSSDQGNFYGQHGLWQHTVVTSPSNLYEAAMNIPLILRQPGRMGAGRRSDALVGQYDIPVMILDYLGIDVEFDNSPGRSFAGLLRGEPVPDRPIFYEQEETRGVRTREYAYWRRLDGTGQDALFDMHNDPGQQVDLAGDANYRSVRERLRTELDTFFSRYSEPRYDLWRGGVAKGSVVRPGIFRELYGPEWSPRTELLPPFRENGPGPAAIRVPDQPRSGEW